MARGLTSFTLHLTRARFASREGESFLFIAAVLALTVAATLAFTVGGGTWMFVQRWREPTGIHAQMVEADAGLRDMMLQPYVGLAALACMLLVPTIVSLVGSAAVLGARGRQERMATLRLIGLSSGQVTRMVLVETILQALVGVVLGYLVYLLTLPAWTRLQMQAMQVRASEMLLPAWLTLAIAAATLLIAVLSAALGMRRVRVSPLGVARRASSPALRWWRLLVFVGLLGLAWVLSLATPPDGQSLVPFLVVGTSLLVLVTAMNIGGPWLLQLAARSASHLPGASLMTASRRVAADPRSTWGRVAGIGLMTFMGTYVAMMPLPTDRPDPADAEAAVEAAIGWDITQGAFITLAIGLVVTATATYITQASSVFERADQSRALQKMGTGLPFQRRVVWLEVLGPLVMAIALGAGLGAAIALPLARASRTAGFEQSGQGPLLIGLVLGVGLLLAALAVLATGPLHRRVVSQPAR